jgi:hypothetical protein
MEDDSYVCCRMVIVHTRERKKRKKQEEKERGCADTSDVSKSKRRTPPDENMPFFLLAFSQFTQTSAIRWESQGYGSIRKLKGRKTKGVLKSQRRKTYATRLPCTPFPFLCLAGL